MFLIPASILAARRATMKLQRVYGFEEGAGASGHPRGTFNHIYLQYGRSILFKRIILSYTFFGLKKWKGASVLVCPRLSLPNGRIRYDLDPGSSTYHRNAEDPVDPNKGRIASQGPVTNPLINHLKPNLHIRHLWKMEANLNSRQLGELHAGKSDIDFPVFNHSQSGPPTRKMRHAHSLISMSNVQAGAGASVKTCSCCYSSNNLSAIASTFALVISLGYKR
ncbi:hypothetical protein WG66_000888 [Moniliophthora roreri]|nr:hypothetical protein WG66_000888 [Moniliophthora roreri]